MEDLLQPQIQDSCRLALPEGLRDLMSDISREVLRAQPTDLYNFIVSYLEAMLLARDTLCVACRVCSDVCQCTCHPELEEELRNLDLDEEDLETVKNVVMEYFYKDDVKEENLLVKLFNKTNIDANLLPDIQNAVREAFQKHQRIHRAKYWVEASKTNDLGQEAAKHTLQFYDRVLEDREQSWDEAATKVQAAFRGSVMRDSEDELSLKLKGKLAEIDSSKMIFQPPVTNRMDEPERASTSKPVRNNVVRVSLSSTSLAGSLINLPKYVPYSVHDLTYLDFEEHEMERKNIDYTLDSHFKDSKKEEGTRRIAFYEQHVLHEIKSCSIEKEDDIEEQIAEDIQSEAVSVDENITHDKSVEDVDGEIESTLNEDRIEGKSINDDIIHELVSHTAIRDDSLIKSTVYESNVDEASVLDSNVDKMIEENQQFKREIERTQFDGPIYKTYPDYNSIDEYYVEEEIEEEEENIDKKKSMANMVNSKAHIEMIKNLKKKLITLSNMAITNDKTQDNYYQDDKQEYDSTSD